MYLKSGTTYRVTSREAIDLHDRLPAATFSVKYDERANQYYLEVVESFTTSGKIYGDTIAQKNRILATFHDRAASTGVVLAGSKGSGKTLLAKLLSIDAATEGIPTLLVNQPFRGEEFNSFIQGIDQEAVIIFDEFEKVYSREQQPGLLTLLDGVYSTKKLFVLTCNDQWHIDSHMRNRPGRIFYRLDFTGVSPEFIEEYCGENLTNTGYIESIVRLSTLFDEFNFDILKALVEEMNRYGEDPQTVMRMLNAKPEMGRETVFTIVELQMNGKTVAAKLMEDGGTFVGNPLNGVVIEYEAEGDGADRDWRVARFAPTDLVALDGNAGTFRFENPAGMLRLARKKPTPVDYSKLY